MGGAGDAGPAAIVLPAGDVRQRGCVAAGGAGAIARVTVGAGCRIDDGPGGAASPGVRRIVDRAPPVATALWTSNRGAGTETGRSHGQIAGHCGAARPRRK